MLNSAPTPAPTQEGTSRRTIVRGAAAAAWAVPAITLASPAPAFAASSSGVLGVVLGGSVGGVGTPTSRFTTSGKAVTVFFVFSSASNALITGSTATVFIPAAVASSKKGIVTAEIDPSRSDPGWAVGVGSSTETSGYSYVATFIRPASGLSGSNARLTLTFTLHDGNDHNALGKSLPVATQVYGHGSVPNSIPAAS